SSLFQKRRRLRRTYQLDASSKNGKIGFVAFGISYASMCFSTSAVSWCTRDTIHWSKGFLSDWLGSSNLPSHSHLSTSAYIVKKSYMFHAIASLRCTSATS